MSKKILLIVEDEKTLLKALKKKFTSEGFGVMEARNGEEGLKKAIEEKPDLILLDIIMPVMDGMTMLEKLRQDEWGRTAQVIMLTNLSEDKQVLQAQERKVYDYLIKSDWKMEDLIKKVKEKLGS